MLLATNGIRFEVTFDWYCGPEVSMYLIEMKDDYLIIDIKGHGSFDGFSICFNDKILYEEFNERIMWMDYIITRDWAIIHRRCEDALRKRS